MSERTFICLDCGAMCLGRLYCRICYQARFKKTGRRDQALEMVQAGRSLSEIGRQFGISRQRVDQLLNAAKHNARRLLNDALKRGLMVRPDRCERCERGVERIEAHHADYSEAYVVRWLCPACHSAVHPHPSKGSGKAATCRRGHSWDGNEYFFMAYGKRKRTCLICLRSREQRTRTLAGVAA